MTTPSPAAPATRPATAAPAPAAAARLAAAVPARTPTSTTKSRSDHCLEPILATRRTTPPQSQPANLSVEQMKVGIVRLRRRIADLEAFNPESVQQRRAPEVQALETSIE